MTPILADKLNVLANVSLAVILERSLREPGCLTHMMIKYLITDTHIFEMPSA